ncbi:MAG: hypothetical protein JWN23_2349 [Rhodocyclales bacterium]|nr:hypothetical protein [Rhodocyclales bacterium]
MRRICLTFTAFVLTLIFLSQGHAQTLYRCGKTFQDRPCEGPVEGMAIGTAKVRPTAQTAPTDAVCTQQGNDALKLMWMKEAGRTEQEQITEARSKGGSPEFIHYVYGKRGTATEVRTLVEADCAADQERKVQAAKLAAAAGMLAGQTVPSNTAKLEAPQQASAPSNAAAEKTYQDDQARKHKEEQCHALVDQINSTKASQRAGGGIAAMDGLNRQMHDLENQRHALGC